MLTVFSDEVVAGPSSAAAMPDDPYSSLRFPRAGEKWVIVSVSWQQTRTETRQVSAVGSESTHYGRWVCVWESRPLS
jgi:hypothetical protein